MNEDKTWLNPDEVSAYLGISTVTVYRYMNQKQNPLPRHKVSSGTILILKSELDDWIKKFKN